MNEHIPHIENLAQTLPGIIYRVDAKKNRPVFISHAVFDACGYHSEELLNGNIKWLDLVVPEDRPLVASHTSPSSVSSRFSIEYRITHRSGEIRWILNRAICVRQGDDFRWRDGIILDITTSRTSELELEVRNNDFANLLTSLDDIVFEIGADGRFSNYYSKEWHSFVLPPDEVLNKTIHEAFAGMADLPYLMDMAYRTTIREQADQDIECTYLQGKRLRWFRAKFKNLVKPGTVSIMIRDITKRRSAEVALKKREQELELAIKGGDLGIWTWHIASGSVVFNGECARMLGYSHDDIHPHVTSFVKLIHPRDKPQVIDAMKAHLDGKTEFYEAEYRLRHRIETEWIWILHRSKIVEHDHSGRPARIAGVFFDISGRKKAERANVLLQHKLEEFKAAVDQATIVSIADTHGTITYANENFTDISQFPAEELIGKKHNVINSGHHPRSFWRDMWQTITSGNVWRGEVRNKRKDGTFYWVDTFIIPLRNEQHRIIEYLSIRNDITEKKENEIRLESTLKKATESDRLKSAFLANISHEIRTPMNAISGFSELLMNARLNLSTQKQSEFIRLIYQRSQDLLAVVNNILEISKLEAGQVSKVAVAGDLRELFDKLLAAFRAETVHLKNKNLRISAVNNLSASENVMEADFLRLYQVLNNLLSNAARFTSEGAIEFGCKRGYGDMLQFWVRDTGIGIPPDKLDIIFMPFRQADDHIHQVFGGSGLGLAISKGLVELWGGEIWAESKVGTGSVFYFTMPYHPLRNLNEPQAVDEPTTSQRSALQLD